jgi:signal transduction histidine kinase
MTAEPPLLLLVGIPAPLRVRAERAFRRVWAGRIAAVDRIDGSDARLAVAMADTLSNALAVVRAQAATIGWLVVGEGARQARSHRGGLPSEVPWALAPEELGDPRLVALAVRLTLEITSRRRSDRQLQAALPMADLGVAAAGVAHELGNPLTGLLTNLELARIALTDERVSEADLAALRANVSDALEGARHLARVAADLGRASSRSGRLGTVDVRAVVDTAIRLARPSLVGVEVRRVATRAALARVDEGRLCQVLVNLLKNAAEALRGQSRRVIEVEVDAEDPAATPRSARDFAGGHARESVIVRVSDSGPGVPAAVAPRLFEPYVTTRADGTGLGLALCRRYLSEMSGSISLTETSPAGTTFELRLVPAFASDHVRPTLVPDFERGRFRVLVLDDMPLIRRSILRALSPPHDVHAVATAEDALALLETHPFDVLLLDLDLGIAPAPGQTCSPGIAFHQTMRAKHPHRTPAVVFVSGDYGEHDLAYIDRHQLAWIRKPFGAEDLRQLVSELTANPRPRRGQL